MGTPLGPKYIPYSYMDPLGLWSCFAVGIPRRGWDIRGQGAEGC